MKDDTVTENLQERTDIFVDPSKDTVVYKRYYHMFREGELEKLVLGLVETKGWLLDIEKSFYDRDNWFVVIRVNGRQ
jgi:hypothetical protein